MQKIAMAVLGSTLALVASGCAPGADTSAPEATAVAFYANLVDGHPGQACDLLADEARIKLVESAGSSCADALGELELNGGGLQDAEAYGRNAMVTLENDTTFLTRTSSGRRVIAAACIEQLDKPYRCQIEAS